MVVINIIALHMKSSFRNASYIDSLCLHSISISCIKGSRNTSISMPGCLGPEIRIVRRRYFLFWHNHVGILYMIKITGQVMWSLILLLKEFIPSVLNKSSHNQMWSDDSHICPCHTVLAIFTGTNNYILILCQCRCMLLCGLNKFIHLFTKTCL